MASKLPSNWREYVVFEGGVDEVSEEGEEAEDD